MGIHGLYRAAALWSAAGIALVLSTSVAMADDAARAAAPGAKSAAELVRAALESEAAGKLDDRAVKLREALAADPDYAPAHWHSGQVTIDGRWVAVGQESAAGDRNGRLEKYRKLRQELTSAPSVADHLRLAQYCREAGLADQERLHLALVLQLDRGNKEALTKLKALRRPLDPKAAARLAKAQEGARRQHEETFARWKDQMTRLRDDLTSGDAERQQSARTQLLALRDVEAIPALESVLSATSPENARLVVSILTQMPQQQATVSLAKHAVLSQWADVREKAALALKPRDLFAYAPPLLAHMAMPVEVDLEVVNRYGGAVGHRLNLFQEGPMADSSFLSMNVYTPEPVPAPPRSARYSGNTLPPPAPAPGTRELRSITTVARPPVEKTATDAAAVAVRVERFNQRTKQLNERIAYVLRTATGASLPDVPTQWWSWWCDYNEMYYPDDKPIYESGRYTSQPYAYVGTYVQATPPAQPSGFRTRSCFVAGTPVWTPSGPIAIEKLLVGEDVLSQDAMTGELNYRPILATTVRPPAQTIAVKLGGEEILVTRGHPFFVSGAGWRMAKELNRGDFLHTPDGACPIDKIEERSEYPTHNLVVAGFNSYFVGNSQVLVHDNNLREATPTVVPGLAR